MSIATPAPLNIEIKSIVIAGAGAIGNFIGVQLHKAGFDVIFLGSRRIVNAEKQFGLVLEYPNNLKDVFLPARLTFTTDPHCCSSADLIINTTKSQVTDTLIEQIRPHITPRTKLLTLQNGISNASVLKLAFPDHYVCAGMVTFNVIEKSPSVFRLTTNGQIYLEKMTPSLLPVFLQAGIAAKEHADIESVLWSKLLLNPLNALSGRPLKQDLEDHNFRLQWAVCMREGLAVLKTAGIKTAKITPLPLSTLPFVVSLPNWIYLRLTKYMATMDPTAKSSMAQDMEKGKKTEISYLTGELIRLGQKVGVATLENQKIYNAIKQTEEKLTL